MTGGDIGHDHDELFVVIVTLSAVHSTHCGSSFSGREGQDLRSLYSHAAGICRVYLGGAAAGSPLAPQPRWACVGRRF